MARLREGNPNRICLHHSATTGVPADLTALKKRLASYEVYHSKKTWAQTIKTPGEYGYNYIEYHIAIAGNGHEIRLQDDKYVLYHAGDNANGANSFNLHGIAVLIDGNYMTDQPNANQLEAFARIIARFEKQYKVDVLVRGHKEVSISPTSCPGINLGDSTQGFLRQAIDRANIIIKNNLPTNPLQDDIPPVPEPSECEKQVETLKQEIKGLTEALAASQGALKGKVAELVTAQERVKFLEDTLLQREKDLKALEEDYTRLLEEKNRFEKQYTEAVTELNELKQGRDSILKKIGDIIYKLFSGGK
jgi:hypothetical protein